MKKRIVRIVLLVLLTCLFSVYGSIEPRMPSETNVFAKNVIIKGPFMTPKMVSKEEFQKTLGYDWTNEVPYKMDNPYKGMDEPTIDDFPKDYPWPLEPVLVIRS